MEKMASNRKRSAVWIYMKKTSPSFVVCLICKSTLKYNESTTSLMRHIRSKHPHGFEEIQAIEAGTQRSKPISAQKKPLLPPSSSLTEVSKPALLVKFDNKNRYTGGNESDRKRELDMLIVQMIVSDLQPVSFVEDQGFRKLVNTLDPKYSLPSCSDLTLRLLPKLYNEHKALLERELEDASSIAITADIWTSRKTEEFLTVTAHFVSSRWEQQSAVLESVRIMNAYTAEQLATELSQIFQTWNISEKISCIVTDNIAVMEAAVAQLNVTHIPCYAHTLNQVVHDTMQNVEAAANLKNKIQDITSYFHHSVEASETLADLQAQQGKLPLKLKHDTETRWNASYYMFKRYIELHEFVTDVLYSSGKEDLLVTTGELDMLKQFVQALESFELATQEMCSEKFTSLSKVIPMTKSILEYMTCTISNSDTFPLTNELMKQVTRHFSDFEEKFFLGAATLLDPRFKDIPFGDYSKCKIIEHKLFLMMKPDEPEPGLLSIKQEPGVSPPTPSLWSLFDQKVQEAMNTTSRPVAEPVTEFRRYYEERPVTRYQDPFLWWQEREKLYPKLLPLAQQFLSIPATSVSAGQLFTKTGEQMSLRRSNLKDSLVDKILFLNKRF